MPVKNKNRQSNSGYEGVITGLNDEEKKVLEDAGIGGGDIWLDITPYLSDGENRMSISQEGYDLIYNAFSPNAENATNKYVGILVMGTKLIFDRLITSDTSNEECLNFIFNITVDGVKGYVRASICNDKSVEFIDEMDSSSNKIWYDLDTMSGTITQNQYNEIKSLIDSNSLAGLAFKTLSTYCPLANIFDGGIFVFRGIGLGLESTGADRKNAIDESTITIKSDLSITFNLEEIFFPVLTQNLSNQSIISVKTDGYQQNLTIGDGLKIENGALKATSSGIPTANVNSETFKLDTSSLTNKDQYVIASMDDGGGNIQYIPLQTYFTNAGYFNKEVKMQNYSRGFSLSLTDISFTSANNYTVNAKNTNVDFTSSLDSSKTWNKKGELKYITIEEQNILTGEKTYDYLEISGGDYSTEISALNSRVDSLANEVSQYSGSISSLESRVSSLETASTSYAQAGDVDMLNSRVSDIENTIGDINSILDNINGEVI